ncbi:MAG: hypothetical protein EXR77_13245 [Myxococcales bacterium]|nr:hypothetical protein [Myxococcales bacterium]
MATHRNLMASCAALALVAVAGCEPYFDRGLTDAGKTAVADDAVSNFPGLGIGGPCGPAAGCRAGLTCEAGKCLAKPVTPENGKCLLADECAIGLHCSWAGFCTAQPAGTAAAGAACEKSSDCSKGLFCKQLAITSCPAGASGCGNCTAPSASVPAPEGEECTSAAQCPPGMNCETIGLSGECKSATGQGDLGAKCTVTADCRRGLSCSPARKECIPGSLLLNPDLFGGVECNDTGEAKAPFGAVVAVPRVGVATDYYSMPFPSDLHKKGGKLDLTGHPRPGFGVIGFDAVDRVAESMAADMTGWGLTTAAYMRFTRTLDPKTLKAVPQVPKEQATVRLINLTTGADVPLGPKDSVVFHEERNKYICRNWLYVHARWSEVLDPDKTYAVIVTDGVRQACGNGLCDKTLGETNLTCANDCTDKQADTAKPLASLPAPAKGADIETLLAEAKPTNPALEPAWKVYAPLRTFLMSNAAVKPITATVFTTMDSRKTTQQLVELVAAANKPAFAPNGTPVVCATGVKSPCADDSWLATTLGKAGTPDPRSCPANADTLPFFEIHAKLTLPKVQTGKRPYLNYSKSTEKEREGAIKMDATGKPALLNYENVCVAITIPRNQVKPVAGWPLAIFGHGTGGSFRSGAEGMAASLSQPAITGSPIGIATLGFDAPMHANRRGTDDLGKPITTDPGPLFYNFANPAAARGNFWQGATDKLALFRFAKEFGGEGIVNAVLGKVHFDPGNLIFIGHSQGSTTGPLAVPYMNGLKGAVFSGCGGSLTFGLLGKKKPIDASVGMQIGLQDLGTDPTHPVLNLLQNYFEASDPLIYAPLLHIAPVNKPIHVLHTIGHGDSFTPISTSRIFAAAARTTGGMATPVAAFYDKMDDLAYANAALPIANNVNGAITAVSIQAKNDAANSLFGKPYDGHFVAFNDKTMVNQVLKFLGSLVKGAPSVPK